MAVSYINNIVLLPNPIIRGPDAKKLLLGKRNLIVVSEVTIRTVEGTINRRGFRTK